MTVEANAPASERHPTLGRADRLQPIFLLGAIVTGLALGSAIPALAGPASRAVSIGVFALIALVMLNVDPRNVANTLRRRRFLAAALTLNFVVNPTAAWLLGTVFLSSEPGLRAGLILFLVTPCIGWYLIFTELAGGDTELGVGLLGINVILQVALLPVYLTLFLGEASTIGVSTILESIAMYLVAPAVVAGGVRRWWSRRGRIAADEQERLHTGSWKSAALAVVIVSMFASQADEIFDDLGSVVRLVAPMTLFFGLAFVLAILMAKRIGLPDDQTALLVFTTTSRNSEASLAIAATAFSNPLVALTVALGPVIELPLLIIMVRILRRRRPAHLTAR